MPLLALFCVTAIVGCPQDMADQPRYEALEKSEFPGFDNGMASRPLVDGTVARGNLRIDDHYFKGKLNEELVTEFPPRIMEEFTQDELLTRGEQQYKIYCSHCHGSVGGGSGGDPEMENLVGMVVKRGFPMPPTYHSDRLREMPVGHFFDVITNGYGKMAAHNTLVDVEDRWAIAAWIRTLQYSQHPQLAESAGDSESDSEISDDNESE